MLSRKNIGLYVVTAAILAVGLAFVGKSAAPWVFALVLLACPVMMMFMVRGMHGRGSGGGDNSSGNAGGSDATDRTGSGRS
jgi:hypothetical protein